MSQGIAPFGMFKDPNLCASHVQVDRFLFMIGLLEVSAYNENSQKYMSQNFVSKSTIKFFIDTSNKYTSYSGLDFKTFLFGWSCWTQS